MAENVYKKLEDMLPELEDLERNGIFTRDELRIIIKKRTDFEYKLQRKAAEKEDFIGYLQYELSVHMLRRRRVERLGLNSKYSPAENEMRKRMHSIFQKALRKFADDLKLWLQYIDFCKKMRNSRSLGRAFARLLQLHPRKANFWVLAAKNEFEENNNVDAARALLQQALKVNPQSQLLWRECCRLELLHVDKIRRRRQLLNLKDKHDSVDVDNASEGFLNNKTARIVYNKAIEAIPDSVEFRVSFLPLLRLFKNTEQNITEIYDSLHDFPESPLALSTLAQRTVEDLKAKSIACEKGQSVTDEQWIEAEKECYENYMSFTKKHPSGELWEMFARSFLELMYRSQTRGQASRRLSLLLGIFSNAEKEAQVTEDMFLSWAQCYEHLENASTAIKVLNRGTRLFGHSKKIWQLFLELKCRHASAKVMINEFERCLETVDSTVSLDIWRQWIDCFVKYFPSAVENVFEMATTKENYEVYDFASLAYIDWVVEKQGAPAARRLYYRLNKSCTRTPSLQFLQKGITLENYRDVPKLDKLRPLYDKIVTIYGTRSIDVWLDYIRFEMNNPECATDSVSRVYLRAMKNLQDHLVADFVSHLSLMQAGN